MIAYEELTPKGQARRLRTLAKTALREFGITDYKLKLIKHLVNTTFRLDCADGRFVLRIHRTKDRTPSEIQSEVTWMAALAHDADITVQKPKCTPDGRVMIMAQTPGIPEPLPVTILSWIKGRILKGSRTPRHFAYLGILAAKLHAHAQHWTPPANFDRPTYDADGFIGPRAPYPFQEIGQKYLTNQMYRDLETVYTRVSKIEQAHSRNPKFFGLIHRDLSFSNVLYAHGEAMPIDFDEGGFGFYLHDLASSLAGAWLRSDYQSCYETFVEAYRETRAISDKTLSHIPTFMATRTAAMLLYTATRMKNDHPYLIQTWERMRSMM